MGFLSMIKGWWNRMFKSEAKSEFGTTAIISGAMETAIRYWMDIYSGRPDWVDPEDNIKTIKFAKSICSETARLVTLAVGVSFDGSRGDYMENWNNNAVMPHLRKWVEYGCAFGTIVLKPNGNGVDIVTPANFEVTEVDGMGKITGMRFQDRYKSGDNWYTKLEQHSFRTAKVRYEESGEYEDVTFYLIQNRAYISNNEAEIGKPINLSMTKWSMLQPDVTLTKKNGENIDSMLFGVFTMPNANDLDLDSPYGMSLFSEAVEELKDLDIAYSRFTGEIKDSQDIELLGETMLQEPGRKVNAPSDIKLPHHVKRVPGTSEDDFYQAIERPLRSSDRQVGINHLLSEIGYKCGYSNGYFVLDQKTGMVTATQVEADDRRTIQLIKDIRDALRKCLDDLYYSQSVFADLYNYAPVGNYVPSYDFGDITYNEEEDRKRWWQYVTNGKVPFWMYLVKFEGYSEEDAKAIGEEMKADSESKLFGEE